MAEPSRAEIVDEMHRLLDARDEGKTICPSDVARSLRPDGDWRALMEPVREAGDAEAAAGRVEFTQGGEVVDRHSARGPLRIRRTSPPTQ